jgi:hypothetical protein
MKKACWITVLLLAVMATPSAAIFLTCDEICNCARSCSHPCRYSQFEPYTNCGSIGTCIGGSECTLLASAGLAAIFAPEVCTDEAAEASAPAPAPTPTPAPAAEPAD